MKTFKNCVRVFSGSVSARILKFGTHMVNELLYCWIENRTHCPFICHFGLNLCHNFLKNYSSANLETWNTYVV